jgi:hypothetical protein
MQLATNQPELRLVQSPCSREMWGIPIVTG